MAYVVLVIDEPRDEEITIEWCAVRASKEDCFLAAKTWVLADFIAMCESIGVDPEEEEKVRFREAKTLKELNDIMFESERRILVTECDCSEC